MKVLLDQISLGSLTTRSLLEGSAGGRHLRGAAGGRAVFSERVSVIWSRHLRSVFAVCVCHWLSLLPRPHGGQQGHRTALECLSLVQHFDILGEKARSLFPTLRPLGRK